MRQAFIAGLTLLLAASPSLAAQKKMKGDNLSNIIIQGENRLKVSPRVPDVAWSVSPYREVTALLADPGILAEMKPPAVANPPLVLPEKTLSGKTASPWLSDIYEAPVLTLNLKGADKTKPVQWTFLVKDSAGKTFYELKKKSVLPDELKWDGRGKDGTSLKVGYDYTYIFSSVDQAGNPQRFAGKPFRLDSFRHKKGGKTVTAFQPEALFVGRNSVKFSPEGARLLTEMKDGLRAQQQTKIEIVSYDDDVKFAAARAVAVRDVLAKALELPESIFVTTGLPQAQGGGYRHVDVVAK